MALDPPLWASMELSATVLRLDRAAIGNAV
jgi:hypothetical protein